MSASAKRLALVAALLLLATAARSDGIGSNMVWPDQTTFGTVGGAIMTSAGPPPVVCTTTGLKFNLPCNTQYLF